MEEKKNSTVLSEAAIQARRQYQRTYRQRNKKRTSQYTKNYWEKRAAAQGIQSCKSSNAALKSKPRWQQINFRVDMDFYYSIRKAAFDYGISASEWVRQVLKRELDETNRFFSASETSEAANYDKSD